MDTTPDTPAPQGAASPKYRRDELRPLPMRITQRQYERLLLLRDFDNLNIQEHVRRALDLYLNATDMHHLRAKVMAGELPVSVLANFVPRTTAPETQDIKIEVTQPPLTAEEVRAQAATFGKRAEQIKPTKVRTR